MLIRLSVIAALALTALSSAFAQTERVAPNVFRTETSLTNGWALVRYTQDKAGKVLTQCAAFKMTGSELGLHFGVDKAGQSHESYRRPRRSSRYWTFEAARRRWTLRPPLCLTGA
jgi:hypothetical protein